MISVAARLRRGLVAWIGDMPPVAATDVLREYGCSALRIAVDDVALGTASAVVFTQRGNDPGELMKDLRQHSSAMLDQGCRVLVRVEPGHEETFAGFLARTNVPVINPTPGLVSGTSWNVHPYAMLSTKGATDAVTEWRNLAQFLTDSEEEPVQFFPRFLGPRAKDLPPQYTALLRRAFSDCEEVRLNKMPQGRSGASLLLAYATVARPVHGEAAPLFVKFGTRDEVATEHQNYESHVRPFVPYHLGPHLVARRCGLGAQEGVLVGTFVDESESLFSCARTGRATGVLSALLNRSLGGWRQSARIEELPYGAEVAKLLPLTLDSERVAEARRLKARHSLDELRERLSSMGRQRAWRGHLHGDLHAENVRVRGGDAVLIDFGKCTSGPLLCDPASLEASFLVGDFYAERTAGEDVRFASWRKRVSHVCTQPLLASQLGRPDHHGDWLYPAVQAIRLHAMNMELVAGQYALALGAALIRAAARRTGKQRRPADSRRRAFAYVLGERLIVRASI